MKKYLIVSILLFLFFSCKDEAVKLNGSSVDAFNESVEKAAEKLPFYQRERLKEAIEIIWTYDSPSDQAGIRWSKVRNKLNGKTAEEVFEWANKIAQEKGLNWSSENSTGKLVLKDEKIDDFGDSIQIDYTALREAKKLKIQVRYFDKNKDGTQDGIMIYPMLLDEFNNTLDFDNIPLNSYITLRNEGNTIYSTRNTFNNSAMGNAGSTNGIFVPFGSINFQNIVTNVVDVEMRTELPEQILSAGMNAVPFDATAWKMQSEIQNVQSEQVAEQSTEIVKTFLNNLANGNLQAAYNMSNNPKWKDYVTFSSSTLGFGNIADLQVDNVSFSSFASGKATVNAQYKMKDKQGANTTMKQQFELQNRNGSWIITNSKVISSSQ